MIKNLYLYYAYDSNKYWKLFVLYMLLSPVIITLSLAYLYYMYTTNTYDWRAILCQVIFALTFSGTVHLPVEIYRSRKYYLLNTKLRN